MSDGDRGALAPAGGRACRFSRRWLAAGVAAAACLAALAAGWDNSATNDEPYHVLAAFTYVHDGHADLNPEHPPLAKLLSGAALLPLGLQSAAPPPVERLRVLSAEVRRFLYHNAAPAATILRTARLPQLLFLLLLLIGVFEWTRWAFDDRSALLATLAVACQPLVLGHSFVVHTDVAAAAGWIWTLYLLQRWLAGRKPGWLGFGAALGVTLLAKFSAVYLVPIAAVAVLAAVARSRRYREVTNFVGAGVVALAVAAAGMAIPSATLRSPKSGRPSRGFCSSGPGPARFHSACRRSPGSAGRSRTTGSDSPTSTKPTSTVRASTCFSVRRRRAAPGCTSRQPSR